MQRVGFRSIRGPLVVGVGLAVAAAWIVTLLVLVRLEGIPIDVSGMMVTNEHRPLLAVALSDALSDRPLYLTLRALRL